MVLIRITLRALCVIGLVTSIVPTPSLAESPGGAGITISDGNVVSLEYTLTLQDKEVLDTNVGEEPLIYTQGAHQIVPGLENALAGMKAGESKQVTVAPEDGYGKVDERRIQEVPIEHIPPDARKPGIALQGKDPNGRIVRPIVREVHEHMVILDFNHPLAGKTLYFDVQVLDVQPGQPQTP